MNQYGDYQLSTVSLSKHIKRYNLKHSIQRFIIKTLLVVSSIAILYYILHWTLLSKDPIPTPIPLYKYTVQLQYTGNIMDTIQIKGRYIYLERGDLNVSNYHWREYAYRFSWIVASGVQHYKVLYTDTIPQKTNYY